MSSLAVFAAASIAFVGIASALKKMEQSAETDRFRRRTRGLLP
jgi:hypothetical protein